MKDNKDETGGTPSRGVLSCVIKDPLELNLAYMPFIVDGGLFIPTADRYVLGDTVWVDLQLPGRGDPTRIEGCVVWITPQNALHHVLPGIGIQFIGPDAKVVRTMVESNLDNSFDVGGYTYGITEDPRKEGK